MGEGLKKYWGSVRWIRGRAKVSTKDARSIWRLRKESGVSTRQAIKDWREIRHVIQKVTEYDEYEYHVKQTYDEARKGPRSNGIWEMEIRSGRPLSSKDIRRMIFEKFIGTDEEHIAKIAADPKTKIVDGLSSGFPRKSKVPVVDDVTVTKVTRFGV